MQSNNASVQSDNVSVNTGNTPSRQSTTVSGGSTVNTSSTGGGGGGGSQGSGNIRCRGCKDCHGCIDCTNCVSCQVSRTGYLPFLSNHLYVCRDSSLGLPLMFCHSLTILSFEAPCTRKLTRCFRDVSVVSIAWTAPGALTSREQKVPTGRSVASDREREGLI